MSKILPIQSVAGSRIREFGWSRRASAMYSCQPLGSLAAGRQKFTVTSLLCEHPQNAVGAVHLERTLIVHTDVAGFPSFLTKAAMVGRVSQGPRGRAGRLTSTRLHARTLGQLTGLSHVQSQKLPPPLPPLIPILFVSTIRPGVRANINCLAVPQS